MLPSSSRGQNATVGGEEVIEYCHRNIAKYKSPKQVFFLEAMPISGSGKVLKTELRKALPAR